MKKLLVLLLCCLMLLPAALADEMEEIPALSAEEIEIYKSSLLEKALLGTAEVQADENGLYTAITGVGDLTIAADTLTADTHVLGARLAVGQTCPRGLKVGDSLNMIFQVYPNDNPSLVGNYYEATLCIFDNQSESMLGYALREGQRITEVTYVLYTRQSDGIVKSGITFLMDQGYIQQISLFTAPNMLTEEEMKAEISDSALVQESDEYQAHPFSEDGSVLDPFCREDLLFSGLDFYTLTPEKAISMLGSALADEWTADSDGSYIRFMQWDGVNLVSKYDANKQFTSVYSLTVFDDVMEGPRGLRIGDYLDTVLFRFRHSEGVMEGNTVVLYGDIAKAPYGMLVYGTDANTVTYTVDLDGEVIMLYLTFHNDALQEMQLFNLR